ncbi:F-box/WD repeat-containing protein 10 [Nematostella vectensis]|uniref:F-box/WD repeat-containing protein 10 n=1 Tax=Nematostella vectensis TaxID=45351 RepID=UPI00207737F5|nr:F-box/WD repeat-containing protein 10 [Nematostella vectensis]
MASITEQASTGAFSQTRMRQQDKNSRIYELNISRAPELRCVNSSVKSCGVCEACSLGAKLNNAKEWFIRCGEPAKRRFILGLIRRFDSIDLYEYISSILQPLQYKDFTYMRSRSRPSLPMDNSSPPSNHALNEQKLDEQIEEYWHWFSESKYWTKLNFLLGLMQHCDTHLLFIMASNTRTLYEREKRKQRTVETENILDEDDYLSLCSTLTESSGIIQESNISFNLSTTPSKSSLLSVAQSHERIQSAQHSENLDYPTSGEPPPAVYSVTSRTTPKSTSSRKSIPHSADTVARSYKSQAAIREGSASSRGTQSIPQSRLSSAKPLIRKSDFEREFFTEDYMSGEDNEEEDYASVEPLALVLASPAVSYRGATKYKDFLRCLPVHLSKYILGMLDKNSLTNCLCISKHWRLLAEEVQSDFMVHQLMSEEIMLMQGASAKGMDPKYAKLIPVHVPLKEDSSVHPALVGIRPLEATRSMWHANRRNLEECYDGIPTSMVKMEERNVYCGAYNVLVLQDIDDHHRCTNFAGGRLVVSGSYDRKVRLIDSATGKCERAIQGHAGSIRCVHVAESRGVVLSGGYDTSIRCWDIKKGNCKCIFRGHRATVLCISLHGDNLASGSRDKSVKVWNFETGKCRRTFRHRHVVQTVSVSDALVISGCEGGKVKVWDIESATLQKSLDGHHGAITCVKFDAYHVITGSTDCYAMAWSVIGSHKKCLQAFRHPKEVLCLEFLYCRVITGSADGKLRVWNMLNGDCLRLIRGNSRSDPITTICAVENRMVVNTVSNLLIFNFEPVRWDYSLPAERPEGLGSLNVYGKHPPRKLPRSYVRSQRLKRADTRDSLPSRPPSRGGAIDLTSRPPSRSGVLEQTSRPPSRVGVCGRPVSPPRTREAKWCDDGKRVLSAPPRVRHLDSTLSSIDNHVTRINSARKGKPLRPQSSPAKVSFKKAGNEVEETPFNPDSDIRERIHVTEVRQTYPRPPPLPDNRTPHVISRGRSAPVFHTQTLPADKRGWTTSAKTPIMPCENKIMLTAAQARELVSGQRKRPQSASVASKKVSISVNPLKSLSCLNLKTYSCQLSFEDQLKDKESKSGRKTRGRTLSGPVQRPHSCIQLTC